MHFAMPAFSWDDKGNGSIESLVHGIVIYRLQFPTVLEWGSMIFILLGVAYGLWTIGRHRQQHSK